VENSQEQSFSAGFSSKKFGEILLDRECKEVYFVLKRRKCHERKESVFRLHLTGEKAEIAGNC